MIIKNRTSALLIEIHLNSRVSFLHDSAKDTAISITKILGTLSFNKAIFATDCNKLHSPTNVDQRLKNCRTINRVVANFISSDYINRGGLQDYVTNANQQHVQVLEQN